MRGSELTEAQLNQLRRVLRPKLEFITKLRRRMEQTQFLKHDRMYRDTLLAEQVLSDLVLEVETLLNDRRTF